MGKEVSRGEAITHLHILTRLRMRRAILHLPPHAYTASTHLVFYSRVKSLKGQPALRKTVYNNHQKVPPTSNPDSQNSLSIALQTSLCASPRISLQATGSFNNTILKLPSSLFTLTGLNFLIHTSINISNTRICTYI